MVGRPRERRGDGAARRATAATSTSRSATTRRPSARSAGSPPTTSAARPRRSRRPTRRSRRSACCAGSSATSSPTGGSICPTTSSAELDWVQASVHGGQRMPRREMTKRVEEALRNPYVRCLSHPTGRLITRRPENALDLERIYAVAVEQRRRARGQRPPGPARPQRRARPRRAARPGCRSSARPTRTPCAGWGTWRSVRTARRGWATAGDVAQHAAAAVDPRRAPRGPLTSPCRYGGADGRQRRPGARARRARGADHQPRQGAVRRARRDEARPRALLRRGRRAADARDGRPAGADAALPAGRRRPVVLPEARAGQRAGVAARRRPSQTVNGTPSRALVAADVAHVAWAVNLACLGFHVWPYRADDPEHADELRLDLDPQPGTGFAEARAAARELKALLDELGIAGFPKTTGNRGLHVYVRLQPRWDSYAGALRRRGRRARARAPPARHPHRRLVEGGARRADLRRLQPERAAQDGVRRLVGARPQGRAGLDADRAGRSSTTSTPTS